MWIAAVMVGLVGNAQAMGVSGRDMEKPAPQFAAEAGGWEAKLIPRGKSTSVRIFFTAEGGTLTHSATTDFDQTSHEGVDSKNFKSGLFALTVACPKPGATVRLAMRSNFFTSGTAWYVFNAAATPPWRDAGALNNALEKLVNELVLEVADGGPLDGDGKTDGHVTVIGGPRDSFWGYAIGTLFIRFFGIFIVLGILMAGMFVSGWIFCRIEARRARQPDRETAEVAVAAEAAPPSGPPLEMVAAAALALHLKLVAASAIDASASADGVSSWASAGRQGMMNARDRLYRRNFGPLANGDKRS
jgi:hypothetical protein